MNTKVTIKYDGSAYSGWQSQSKDRNLKTVEDTIVKAISIINKEKTEIIGSGRTDRGVHALGQVFNFSNIHNIPLERLKNALNNALPNDIEVISCEAVADDFHARYSAYSKEYHYYLNQAEFSLFTRHYQTFTKFDLDLAKMKEAANIFVGKHDFRSFNATPIEVKMNQTVTIKSFDIVKEDDLFIFKIEGSNFLRHMVRMLVGSVVYAGANKISIETLESMLNNPSGKKSPYNIEPNGLYLYKVNYR